MNLLLSTTAVALVVVLMVAVRTTNGFPKAELKTSRFARRDAEREPKLGFAEAAVSILNICGCLWLWFYK